MNRETFEKICTNSDMIGQWGEDGVDGCSIYIEHAFDRMDTALVFLDDLTPFRLRCLLHGLGIKCDWDEPVTFERLMELEGAKEHGFDRVEVRFDLVSHAFDFTEHGSEDLRYWLCNGKMRTKVMRQVHLLLEAANVSV